MARGNSGEPGDPHADLAGNGMPIDVAAVRRDDALIDAISAEGPVATDSPEEYQVAALLSNWRAEILAQPMPAEPDLDDIVARVQPNSVPGMLSSPAPDRAAATCDCFVRSPRRPPSSRLRWAA